jgi:hypothetical protein
MTAHNDLDRRLNDFLRDGPEELPYESFDSVRDRTERTGQRVVVGPWRLPEMNRLVTIGLGAAAVVVLVFVGAQLLGLGGGGTGFAPTESTEPSTSAEPTPTTEPPATPAASAPALASTFTSPLHGYSVSTPEGWTTRAATESWTEGPFPLSFGIPQADFLYDPALESELFLTVASQPIGDSSPEDWLAGQMASGEGCGTATEPVSVDEASGLIGTDGCNVVVAATADRGYWIQLYTGDEAPAFDATAWFAEVLATVQLHPDDAIDAEASAAP